MVENENMSVDTELKDKMDSVIKNLTDKTVEIEGNRENVSICSDNIHWFDGIRVGADLGIRVTFAYLMKHNLLDVEKFMGSKS